MESSFYGRMAANTGLITAWARYGSGTNLHCVTPSPEDARKLLELLQRQGLDKRPLVRFTSYAQSLPQNGVGTIFRLGPQPDGHAVDPADERGGAGVQPLRPDPHAVADGGPRMDVVPDHPARPSRGTRWSAPPAPRAAW